MRNEKGQALPLAMMALVIGALIIAPFLGHVGSSIIGSHVYSGAVAEQSASDAGIEHAIWSLTRGTLAAQIPNPGDHVTYQLGEALNGATPSVTVTTNATPSAKGSINQTIIDSLDYDTAGYTPDIVKVSNTVLAVVYRGPSNKGYVKTFSIDANGNIGATAIDTLNFETSSCNEPDIIYVTGNIYAIAYRGTSNRGYLVSVSIDTIGNIGNAIIDTLTFDTNTCYEPDLVQVASTIYAVAYRGQTTRGNVKTASIDAAGAISNAVISTLTFDTTLCYTPSIIRTAGNYYGIAYRGPTNRGYLKTVSISAVGVIGGAAISTLIYDSTAGYEPVIYPVAGTYFAVVYRGTTNNGYLKTVSIAANGIISGATISTFIFNAATAYEPDIISIVSDVYAIVYRTSANLGYLKTVTISASGVITQTAVDTFNFDASGCFEPVIIQISSSISGVAYRNIGNHGLLITIGISNGSGTAAYNVVSTAGGVTINALVNTANTTATIVSWLVQ